MAADTYHHHLPPDDNTALRRPAGGLEQL